MGWSLILFFIHYHEPERNKSQDNYISEELGQNFGRHQEIPAFF